MSQSIVVSQAVNNIAAGDHVEDELVHAVVDGVSQDMNDAGWQCHFSLTTANGNYLIQDREVTAILNTEFRVHLTEADCNLMAGVEANSQFRWTIQVKNSNEPFFSRERDLVINVRPGWVSV